MVIEYIDEQPQDDQAVLFAVLSGIQEQGFSVKGCTFRQLEGKLWEIKISAPSGGFRFLYVMLKAEQLQILHAFKKKTQKSPSKELDSRESV